MSVPLYLVLIVVVWALAFIITRRDLRDNGFGSGFLTLAVCMLAIIVTLVLLLTHTWWGVP